MDTIVQKISMDIGFGDIIIQEAVELDYPLLIEGLPPVNIGAYSLETVVAEKFQTMIDRAESNSRMKDFFDVYGILSRGKVEQVMLAEAIREVFANRGTGYTTDHPLFNPEFEKEPARLRMWADFLKKIHYRDDMPFDVVISLIRAKLGPEWVTLNSQNNLPKKKKLSKWGLFRIRFADHATFFSCVYSRSSPYIRSNGRSHR